MKIPNEYSVGVIFYRGIFTRYYSLSQELHFIISMKECLLKTLIAFKKPHSRDF